MLVTKPSLEYATIAFAEEVGEACGKLKRLHRGDYKTSVHMNGNTEFDKDFGNELGDVLYYLVCAAHNVNLTLSDVIALNVLKLQARHAAGTIKGTGDKR